MRRRLVPWILVPAMMVVGAGTYALADATDVVPGFITFDPEDPEPQPFPSAAPLDFTPEELPVTLVRGEAPLPDPAVVQALANALAKDSRTGKSNGISVVDIVTGEVIASIEPADPQVPASTMKLVTAIAVDHGLGEDFRMTTVVKWDGAGTITLIAGGDMQLAAKEGHGCDTCHANGYAGMADLADQISAALTAAGVLSVKLTVDDSAFPGPAINPSWPSYAVPAGYVAPVTGLAVNVAKTRNEPYPPRYKDPSLNAAEVLAARLNERGITVAAPSRGGAGSGWTEIASVESAPMSSVLADLLEVSDNTVADSVCRVFGIHEGKGGSIGGGTAAVAEELQQMGLDTTGLAMGDCSGFSTKDRIPPALLTAAIVATANDPDHEQVLAWLPTGSLTGTLADRYRGTPGAGVVHAKTGSLTGVTSLSGTVVTADGRWLAFTVLLDGMPYGQDAPRAALDEFVAALAGCGCRA